MLISQTSTVIEKQFSPLQFASITQILIFYCKPGTVLGADYIGLDKEDMVISLTELTNTKKNNCNYTGNTMRTLSRGI